MPSFDNERKDDDKKMQPEEHQRQSVWRDPRALALMIAASLTVMTAATISPALPGLEQQFEQNETNAFLVRLLVPAPSLAVVIVAPFCGAVADRSGRRSMLLLGLILFVVSGAAGLVLPTLPSILASRIFLGVALAMIMTAQSALMADYFSGKALHAVSSGQVSARNFGGFVFIMIAGLLASIGPRLPFVVYALPALALPLFWRVIVDPPRMTTEANSVGRPARGGATGVVLWLAVGQMLVTMMFFVVPTQLPFFLSSRGYTSPTMTGAALGALMVAGGITALWYPRFRARFGNVGVWAFGFGIMAVGFATLIIGNQVATILSACTAIGAGYALAIPGFVALSLARATADRRGQIASVLTASVFLGQFLSPLISSPSIEAFGWHDSGLGLAAALGAAAAICSVMFLVHRATSD